MPSSNDSLSPLSLRAIRISDGGQTDFSIEPLNEDSDEPPNTNTQTAAVAVAAADSDDERNTNAEPRPLTLDTSHESTDVSESDSGSSSSPSSAQSSPDLTAKRAATDAIKYLDLNHVASSVSQAHAVAAANYEYDPSAPVDELPPAGIAVSYVNPKLQARVTKTGSGIFALQGIERGEILVVWTGRIVTAEEALLVMDTNDKHYLLQIGDGFYQVPLQAAREPADWTNHSCEPNAGFGYNSPICLSAMRSIAVGEEMTFDYGMCEYDERLWEPMDCQCGSEHCRKSITANDWKLPHLWEKYHGHFAPHVQRRIDQYRREQEFVAAKTVLPLSADDDDDKLDDVSCVDRIMWIFGYARVNTRRYPSLSKYYHAKSQ